MNKIERKQILKQVRKENKEYEKHLYDPVHGVMKLFVIAYVVAFIIAIGVIHYRIVHAVDVDDQPFIYQEK